MSIFLENKKIKRTGFTPAFFCGGILAGFVPILNMTVRTNNYIGLSEPPLNILFEANWQMMAMLNILLIVSGSCIMYHTEYINNAIQKMRTLPLKEYKMFFGKFLLLIKMCAVVFAIEAASLAFCSLYWFSLDINFGMDLLKNFGYLFLLILPAIMLSLVIASICKNIWISLGIGVICIFTATMLPTAHSILALFPYTLSFQLLAQMQENKLIGFICAAVIETIIIGIAELVFLKVRRSFE